MTGVDVLTGRRRSNLGRFPSACRSASDVILVENYFARRQLASSHPPVGCYIGGEVQSAVHPLPLTPLSHYMDVGCLSERFVNILGLRIASRSAFRRRAAIIAATRSLSWRSLARVPRSHSERSLT